MHHQPYLAVKPQHQFLRLREGRRERLLAQHVDTSLGRCLDPSGMGLARRGHVEGMDRFARQHGLAIGIDPGDAELLRPVPSLA